ncbi:MULTISPECIES: cytochrome-c peroxidase [unclassified Microcoleus]|uniref:cytochrome-c peroxidase n=1 Tax=unclassified Microcoleus TaxID=2642155 RepID=UPI001D9B7020|nr:MULTISPECIES: cytochrome c peroxidase [unclassified Microcoleus]MCC3528022.1 cytochrome C peroxidase [Microcoleus sp. PH2017_21_RUC_O_A]MCC3540053.1 cytochrome C peroxidase [Microcoleus sp. PH2017_22_RUC_O_B]
MKIRDRILPVIHAIVVAALLLLLSSTSLAYALNLEVTTKFEYKSADYLNKKLTNLVKNAAPSNQGLEYFILPDSTDLEKIPADPKNPLTHEKVQLGKLLFHETALSIHPIDKRNWKQSSCATCHIAQAGFRSNLAQGVGVGGEGWNKSRKINREIPITAVDKQSILTPSVLNSAYQEIKMWDGRLGVAGVNEKEGLIAKAYVNRFKIDGLEAQAIDGLTFHRMGTAAIAILPEYQELFAKAFPDRPYVGAEVEDINRSGMAIAAYERSLLANQAPFQKWLKGDKNSMTERELKGAIVFFGSSCVKCHTGKNLAKSDFYAVGFADHPKDYGGLNLGRGGVTKRASDDFKFKVPQLYNLGDSSPYGHGASFQSLREVVEYFNLGEPQKLEALYAGNISPLFLPLRLKKQQVDDLTAFLETGLRDPNLTRYLPARIPSGQCFPNNDAISRKQLNCD